MVAGVTQVTAVMADGTEQQANVVWVDQASGTAVLEVAQPTPTLASGQAATLDPGDPVTAAGTQHPGRGRWPSGWRPPPTTAPTWRTCCGCAWSDAVADGAVLLDDDGRAVGICIGHDADDETALLAAPIELAKAATGAPGPDGVRRLAWLGLTGRAAGPDDASTTTGEPTPTTSAITDSTVVVGRDRRPRRAPWPPRTASGSSSPARRRRPPSPRRPDVARRRRAGAGRLRRGGRRRRSRREAGVQEGDIVVAVDDVPGARR